jgi:hypothetical protein
MVMTTEVLRNMLLQTPSALWGVGCIIFDEIHYLADPERGTTWEESIIMCPEYVQLVCLSGHREQRAGSRGVDRPHPPPRTHGDPSPTRRAPIALLLPGWAA